MKKRHILSITALTLSLTSCYLPQNFDNQIQISRTGQYQIDVDTDVVEVMFLSAQNGSKVKKTPIPANDLQHYLANCEDEFNKTVAKDAVKNKHIVSSKYLGNCKAHLKLRYTGNIIQEKSFNAKVTYNDGAGFFIPIGMEYNDKNKQISIKEGTHGDKSAIRTYGLFQYDGKLSIKTDAKVISNNADSKPYWGLIGSYKWNVVDFNTPDASMVISTSGI